MIIPLSLKQKIEDLVFKYQLRREYFTILLPVAVAILLVSTAYFSGFAGFKGEVQQKDDRQKAYDALVAQMAAEGGGEGELQLNTTAKKETTAAKEKVGIDHIIIIATLIAITPFGIDTTLQKRKIRRKEGLYTEFLFKLSELMRGGLNPIKGVVELSKTDLAELTPHVRLAGTLMSYGKGFDEAMRSMGDSLKSTLIRRYTDLIIQASYAGGSVADLILKCSEDMRNILEIEREKEGNLAQYVFIFYFAQGIIVFIAYTLSTSLFPFLASVGATSFLGKNELVGLDFRTGFFHLIIINAFFGGLIIGKITEGEAKFGLKHSAILMAASYLACIVFILPAPLPAAPPANMTISVIGGDAQVGLLNAALKDPIMFQLRNTDGNPVSDLAVAFTITPGGKVVPESAKSDRDGQVSLRATLGDQPGSYVIMADANGITAFATAKGIGDNVGEKGGGNGGG
jgi:flagellar protein FlaJ